jgi:hypothetical protein
VGTACGVGTVCGVGTTVVGTGCAARENASKHAVKLLQLRAKNVDKDLGMPNF